MLVERLNLAVDFLKALPRKHQLILSGTSSLLALLLILPSDKATASRNTEPSLEIGKRYQLTVPGEDGKVTTRAPSELTAVTQQTSTHTSSQPQNSQAIAEPIEALAYNQPLTAEQAEEEKLDWRTFKVKSGDTLARILKRAGFGASVTHHVAKAEKSLTKIKVGEQLKLATDASGQLVKIVYPQSAIKNIVVEYDGEKYASLVEEKQVETRESIAGATITSNFWNAGVSAGMTDAQIMELANIFGWDIDFALDIRAGDTFNVVYEQRYAEGEYIGRGSILAAEVVNQGESFQAIRHEDGDYYTPDGNSMRKAFLRAPVNFKYISSNFKKRRFHPVQKRWKAHRGTDYAANTGTPVVAAGNGKVTHATYNRFNGNYVFIQHGDGIVTKYLHFSKRAVKKGQRVKQGQVIGYVGATGQASGPHLHYEFLVNGVHRNPRTVTLPKAKPLPKSERNAFAAIVAQRLDQLDGSKRALTNALDKAPTELVSE